METLLVILAIISIILQLIILTVLGSQGKKLKTIPFDGPSKGGPEPPNG